eukprot:TRINITY_DN5914_c0_g1_i13.p1 TRINITY_DN5914_c0_g1~~TRINITY_DN5914_c0_g1_i13.p1  ORF type:complete len:1997 (-),score=306.22 TRINITY_DN5914_c0_g1_i13:2138-8128(-)
MSLREILSMRPGFKPVERLSDATLLFLGEKRLSSLPPVLGILTNLRSLHVPKNMLTDLPESLTQLTQLVDLQINYNMFTTLPNFLSNFTQLEELRLWGNPIEELPDWIVILRNLNHLYVDDSGMLKRAPAGVTRLKCYGAPPTGERVTDGLTKLSFYEPLNGYHIGEELTELAQLVPSWTLLTKLDVSNNKISTIPETISTLTKLRVLVFGSKFGGNELPSLPDCLSTLTGLDHLAMQSNKITQLPEWLSSFFNLTYLDIGSNSFTELPGAIANLVSLKDLLIHGNPAQDLPEWITCFKNVTNLGVIGRDKKFSFKRIPKFYNRVSLLKSLQSVCHPKSVTLYQHWEAFHDGEEVTEVSNLIPSWTLLTCINIANNKVSELPDSFSSVSRLQKLVLGSYAGGNLFSSLPIPVTHLTKLKALHLDKNHLSSLPLSILALRSLTHLSLQANKFTEIPHVLSVMQQLKVLSMEENQIMQTPIVKQYAHVHALRLCRNPFAPYPWNLPESFCVGKDKLDLQHRSLIDIHEIFAQFTKKVECHLCHNKLTGLPTWIGRYPELSKIVAFDNKMFTLPDSLTQLSNLQYLILGFENEGNSFSSLPNCLSKCTNLVELHLRNNKLQSLPPWIQELQNMVLLDIRGNKITTLPNQLGLLRSLTILHLDEEQLVYPPPNVVARGTQDIVMFLYTAQYGGTMLWLEGRILLLGEGEVGKTTLCESLVQWKFLCLGFRSTVRHRARTLGAEIAEKALVLEHQSPSVSAHIWDFGGQDIFQVTNPFFLSSGALVLVLYSLEKGPKESKLKQWLELISYFCPNSRLLVVGTRLDCLPLGEETRYDSELDEILGHFKQKLVICAKMKVSNLSGYGIEELKDALHVHMLNLPNVNQQVPAKYIALRDVIVRERRSRPDQSRSFQEMVELGRKELDLNEREIGAALSFLRDLGIIVWHEREPNLRQTVVIDPVFLIDIFKSIFTIKTQNIEKGFLPSSAFTKKVDEMLQQRTSRLKRSNVAVNVNQHLVSHSKALFRHFGLSYEIDDEWEVFPVLMPDQEPPPLKWEGYTYKIWELLHYHIEYDTEIPKNVVSRILISVYTISKSSKLVSGGFSPYFSRKILIFSFNLSSANKIEPGNNYHAYIRFCEFNHGQTLKPASNIDMLSSKKIEVRVRSTDHRWCVKKATEVVIDDIKKRINMSPVEEGFCCPCCLEDTTYQETPSLHDLSLWNARNKIFQCKYGHTIHQSEYQRMKLPVSNLRNEFIGNRTSKESLSTAVEEYRVIRVYISSTFEGMKEIRDGFVRIIQPQIESEAQSYGVSVIFIDLRWGIDDEFKFTGKLLLQALHEVSKADYLLSLLGPRLGWIPDRSDPSIWPSEITQDFPWTLEYPKASFTELEIRAAYLKENPFAFRAFFYTIRTNQDDSYSEQRSIVSEIDKRAISYRFTNTEELETLVKPHILNALQEDIERYNENRLMEDLYHEFFVHDRRRTFCGRDSIRKQIHLRLTLRNASNQPIVIHGKPGIGKSALIATVERDLPKESGKSMIISTYIDCLAEKVVNLRILVKRTSRLLAKELNTWGQSSLAAHFKPEELSNFEELFWLITEHTPDIQIYLLVDGIDKLEFVEAHNWTFYCFPSSIPSNVQIIVTAAEKHGHGDNIPLEVLSFDEVWSVFLKMCELYAQQYDSSCRSLLQECKPLLNPSVMGLFMAEIMSYGTNHHTMSKIRDLTEEKSIGDLLYNITQHWEEHYGSQYVELALKFFYLSETGLTHAIIESHFEDEMGPAYSSQKWDAFFSFLARNCLTKSGEKYKLKHYHLRESIYEKMLYKEAKLDQAWSDYARCIMTYIFHDTSKNLTLEWTRECTRAHMMCIDNSNVNRKIRVRDFLKFIKTEGILECLSDDFDMFHDVLEKLPALDTKPDVFLLALSKERPKAAVTFSRYLLDMGKTEDLNNILEGWIDSSATQIDDDLRAQLYDKLANGYEIMKDMPKSEENRELARVYYGASRGMMNIAAITGRL